MKNCYVGIKVFLPHSLSKGLSVTGAVFNYSGTIC